ncbi:MAG: hypothetical protein ABI840_04150 [bacterium]
MKSKIVIAAVIVYLFSFILIPKSSLADYSSINYPESHSILSINSNGGFTFIKIFSGGINYVLIFDGIQLINTYPE